MSEYHAFSERIGREVALSPVNVDSVAELVSAYMQESRMDSEASIQPFTDDALEVILQRSQGNVRQILSTCSRLLDRALESDRQTIGRELVETIGEGNQSTI
jgi:type II secretory pathway predicted ATPase ExeA